MIERQDPAPEPISSSRLHPTKPTPNRPPPQASPSPSNARHTALRQGKTALSKTATLHKCESNNHVHEECRLTTFRTEFHSSPAATTQSRARG